LNFPTITVENAKGGNAVCWPYFQDCYKLFFYHNTSVDDSRGIFYMALFVIMITIAWSMWSARWRLAHALLVLLFLWEAIVIGVLAYSTASPIYYYHLILTGILLFIPHKEFFLKLTFVFLYFLSATIKFDMGWIAGTYFSTLKSGLPFVPHTLIPIATNIIIFSQVVGCWFLLSRRLYVQRAAFYFFTTFHIYSSILIFYLFPAAVIPPLLIFFGPLYRYTALPFSRTAIAGWTLILVLAVFQLLGFITPGDRRMTLEGNKFGMFMFEANHQCIATVTTYRSASTTPRSFEMPMGTSCGSPYCRVKETVTQRGDISVSEDRYESGGPSTRCDPYEWWSKLVRHCELDATIERVALTFDHSINGGPFYRMVDTTDVCALSYKMFRHNEWIRIPPEAPVVGYPVTNVERD